MNRIRKSITATLLAAAMIIALCALLHWLYLYDNKYTAGPPYGADGVLTCTPADLSQPLFLIDGWEFYPDAAYTPEDFAAGLTAEPLYTFIGQYSNFSFPDAGNGQSHSPFGTATYRLRLRLEGNPCAISLKIPEVFTDYTLWVNGTPAASTTIPGFSPFSQADTILDGEMELIWNVENHTHYYSGLYFPPAVGYPAVIARMDYLRTIFYAVLCIGSLTLAAFSLVLWIMPNREPLFFHFGMFCLLYCISCLHPFTWLAGQNGRLSYALEDTARIATLTEAVWVSLLASGLYKFPGLRRCMRFILPGVCILCPIFITFIIPSSAQFINGYGTFINLCYLAGWMILCISTAWGLYNGRAETWFLLASSCSLGVGFLTNLLNNNRFEPINTGWQMEYAGFLMVLSFSALMVWKNHEILLENRRLLFHMEEMVQKRTEELSKVLDERKNFFSDMAHNLKAPIAAVHGFINLIREGDLYLDEELEDYINMIEQENNEIHQRVSSLNTLNAYDRIVTPVESIQVNRLLTQVRVNNEPDVSVMGIYLYIDLLEDNTVCVRGQWEKLLILFENLIYNAISFTPEGGQIAIHATLYTADAQPMILIQVSDTGNGIAPEHLPHIFERFYVGREDSSAGSGLGLYITRITVEEMGGEISAFSTPGEGTVFEIRLPVSVVK